MKRNFLTVGLLAVLALGGTFALHSCSDSDNADKKEEPKFGKGNWSASDKEKINNAIGEVREDLKVMLGDKADTYIDCYVEKIEKNYDNFESADGDRAGCEVLAKECMEDIM